MTDYYGEKRHNPSNVLELKVKIACSQVERNAFLYKQKLLRLFEKIQYHQPDVLLYADRSARPIQWMISRMYHELQLNQPMTRFINYDKDDHISTQDMQFRHVPLPFPEDRASIKVCIVDEYRSKGRNERRIQQLLNDMFHVSNVEYEAYMDARNHDMPPAFYMMDDDVKELLFGIQDAKPGSLVSAKSQVELPDGSALQTQFRQLFHDIGVRAAVQYRKNHPELFSS